MNKKFIARYAAAAAMIAGVSSQTAAQQLCPIDVNCPPPPPNQEMHLATTQVYSDSTLNPDLIPFNNGDPQFLSVPKFDAAAAAAMHPDAVGPVTLVGVELQLEITVLDLTVTATSTFGGDCDFTWSDSINASIDPVPSLGFSGLSIPQILVGDAGVLPAFGSYDWSLAVDGPGPITENSCSGLTTGLNNWVASGGDTTATFQVQSGASYSFDTGGCGNNTNGAQNSGFGTVNVVYHYCYPTLRGGNTPGCACETPSPHYRRPGSLLLFPEFDNREGDVSIITVTNTDCTGGSGGQDVDVEFIYIDKNGCGEFNKTETLTPCDTISILTNFHNPNQEQGYAYAFAKNDAGEPIVWNHLIGSLLVVSGLEAFDYGINPVAFRGLGSAGGVEAAPGSITDLDGDGNRDLDGTEYEPAPDTITIPRFLGQDASIAGGGPGNFRSQLILIALTGGARFETNVCFLFWNDNEEQFSGEYNFTCWDKPYLDDISFGFRNEFLKTTDHDPLEIIGAPSRESGWICLQGCLATSTQETIDDPAIYAVLVERVGSWGVADLPFECGTRINGSLLPNDVFGDGDPDPQDGDNQ